MEIGLYYYNGRYYAPTLARFISADTIVPDPANPQAFNRYSYVESRPLNFNDPTGHIACKTLGTEQCDDDSGDFLDTNSSNSQNECTDIWCLPPMKSPSEFPSTMKIITDISEAGIAFIAQFESFVPHLYNDAAGHCTVGIGHLVHFGACDGRASEAPYLNGITEQEAHALYRLKLDEAVQDVLVYIQAPLTQAQFDALVSLAYNMGSISGTEIAYFINQGDYERAAEVWLTTGITGYGTGGTVYPGLVRRREYESNLFRTGVYQYDY